MIYLDTSVALAYLFAEDHRPSDLLWGQALMSSRLLEYEMWTRVHARGLGQSHGEAVRQLLSGVALIELSPPVLARAVEAFPRPVRTLDALHLASMEFLRELGQRPALATYDDRLASAARDLGIPMAEI